MKIFNFKKGKTGENIAISYLKKNNYKIISKNYKCKVSEIDIIAIKENILTFIEVKSRTNKDYGMPYEPVDNKKISKIRKGAQIFLISNTINYEGISFDIIEVFLNDNTVNHIVSAF